MTRNNYDDPDFFAGYSQLDRSVHGLDGAAEWPAMRALLPPLHGMRVVDLGCGFGWFARWAREQGAAHVLGVDLSENMLARARAATADPAIEYINADLEQLELPAAAFDLAYSSLALHYVVELHRLLATVRAALRPSGYFVFSVEHPINTAPSRPEWVVDAAGRWTWPLDGYANEGERRVNWFVDGVVKQHRTLAHYLNALIANRFTIFRVEEWHPSEARVASRPEFARERERPLFLLIGARCRDTAAGC